MAERTTFGFGDRSKSCGWSKTFWATREELDGRDKLIATHGKRVVLHQLSQQCDLSSTDDLDKEGEDELAVARRQFDPTVDELLKIVEADFPGYPASLIKNATKVQELAAAVLQSLRWRVERAPARSDREAQRAV